MLVTVVLYFSGYTDFSVLFRGTPLLMSFSSVGNIAACILVRKLVVLCMSRRVFFCVGGGGRRNC